MKTLPELLAIAKTRLAAEEERIADWKAMAQGDVDRALRRAEDAAGYAEHRQAWFEVARAIDRPDSNATLESLLEYSRQRVRRSLVDEGRSTDILYRSRVLARAAAWQEVVNVIVEVTS